jgi:SWI/SNF-related matrix-associated actin-dependent regulator 1 of chromatin subfamily A
MKITYAPQTGRFLAEAKFHEKDILKASGFYWDPDKKMWWTKSKESALKLRRFFDAAALSETAVIEKKKVETFSTSTAIAPLNNFKAPSPAGMNFFPYQQAGIQFALGRTNTLIGDEMGTGKSGQSCGIINCSTDARRILIICPASLKLNWMKELGMWLTDPAKITVLYSNGKHRFAGDMDAEREIFIVNYDIVERFDLKSNDWDILIIDECHYLKNGKSKRRREIWGGREQKPGQPAKTWKAIPAKRTIALTGTPVCNRPSELWTILRALDPETWRSDMWQRFHVRYCGAVKTRHGWDTSGADNLDELNQILRSTIMIRRMKEDVLTELPPKTRKTTLLEANKELGVLLSKEAALQAIHEAGGVKHAKPEDVELVRDWLEADLEAGKTTTVVGTLAKVRRMVGEIKAPDAAKYARELMEGGLESLVIFAHHKDVVKILEGELKEYGVVKIVGETSPDMRQQAVDDFQSGKARIFIGSITAAGVGITLTRATHTLFVEVDWVPGNLQQAEDRTHRYGQRGNVVIEYLIYEGSIDTVMVDAVAGKREVIDQITK